MTLEGTMAVQAIAKIYAWKLLRIRPNAECCDCGKEVEEAREEETWVIYHGLHFYCPRCAEGEGILE